MNSEACVFYLGNAKEVTVQMPKNTSHKKGKYQQIFNFTETKESCKTKYIVMDADDRELSQNKGEVSGATCLNNFYDSLLTVSHI